MALTGRDAKSEVQLKNLLQRHKLRLNLAKTSAAWFPSLKIWPTEKETSKRNKFWISLIKLKEGCKGHWQHPPLMRLITAKESDSITTLKKPCILTTLIPMKMATNSASVIDPDPKWTSCTRQIWLAFFFKPLSQGVALLNNDFL